MDCASHRGIALGRARRSAFSKTPSATPFHAGPLRRRASATAKRHAAVRYQIKSELVTTRPSGETNWISITGGLLAIGGNVGLSGAHYRDGSYGLRARVGSERNAAPTSHWLQIASR
jgi:hypothetical protein